MNSDRAWMYQRLDNQGCLNPAFLNGLDTFMTYMLSLKSDHHWPEACFDQTSQFFKGVLPEDNTFFDSFYSTKKYMEELGLPSEQIDCCLNGCMIYWGEDVNMESCEDVFQEIESLGLMKVTELGSDEHNAKVIKAYNCGWKKRSWLANARRKYSEVVSIARGNWENHNRRDNRIGLDVYLSWVEFWRTEDFKKKSSIQKSNRSSGVEGRPSTHTSGSASHRTVAARVKVQYKRDPTADEVFYLTHTRRVKKKKNPIVEAREIGLDDEDVEGGEDDENFEVVWVDKKSQRIYVLVGNGHLVGLNSDGGQEDDGQEDDGQDDDGQEDDSDGQEDDSNGQDDN
ncbi:hypothetical protein POM88_029367 [Heracleum sosnowskyi]|uniref:Uncharacterized protein n=1 Tax=Heracleum sosnowskyi TaxID=360622 RepID=A0AAD8MHL8_9APIA|nr:hypothetical protein POM88_029367 [Heracleum sosnowskyi]